MAVLLDPRLEKIILAATSGTLFFRRPGNASVNVEWRQLEAGARELPDIVSRLKQFLQSADFMIVLVASACIQVPLGEHVAIV